MRLNLRAPPKLTNEGKRKALGAALVFVGAVVLMRTVPTWIWLACTGAGLAVFGWSIFSQ